MQPNSGPCLILVSGGARSGKSAFAEALAEGIAQERSAARPIAYIATGQAMDPEFEQRIAAHRRRRGGRYATYEAPLNIETAIEKVFETHGVAMVECIPTWLGNIYYRTPRDGIADRLGALAAYFESLWAAAGSESLDAQAMVQSILAGQSVPPPPPLGPIISAAAKVLILVTNETGLGIVPADAASRRYRDDLGWINQRLAAVARAVFFSLAGISRRIK